MKSTILLSKIPLSKRLTLTALFTALCTVSTLVITIPLPNGYLNVGDVFVLLAGWLLGPIYGTIAAGVGCALADTISGFATYALPTLFIKAGVAALAWCVATLIKNKCKNTSFEIFRRTLAAVIAEVWMVLGYFLFESILYGVAGGALALLGNGMQGLCCGVGAVLIFTLLTKTKAVQKLFPLFYEE